MRAELKAPLATASGKIAGLKAGYHARTNKKTGRVMVARNGSPFARFDPTPAQLRAQEAFRRMARQPRRKEAAGEDSTTEHTDLHGSLFSEHETHEGHEKVSYSLRSRNCKQL